MNYETWSRSNAPANVSAPKPEAGLKNPLKRELLGFNTEPEVTLRNQSFSLIAEKNIFHPERKDFLSPGSLAIGETKPVGRPQIVLHGVAIAGDYQSATISNPGQPRQKGERETRTLKIGGKIGEYQLARILPDRIAMEGSGDTFEVLLDDRNKPKRRIELETGAQPPPEVNTAQLPSAAPSTADPAKFESMEKPAGPTKEKMITQAPPIPSKDILISKSMRSASNRLRQSYIGTSNKPNAELSGSTN